MPKLPIKVKIITTSLFMILIATLSFDDDDDDDQDHLIVHGLGFPLSHSLHNLVRLFRHVGQLQNLENGNYGGDDNNNYEGDDNDDEGDDDDDDDDNRAGKFLHRDAALGLHENTSATLGVHLQFEKGGRWSVEEEKT